MRISSSFIIRNAFQMNATTKKIAINGVKNVGKDYVFGKLLERLSKSGITAKRVSMADFLKQSCVEENFPDWDHNGFLRRDVKLAKEAYPDLLPFRVGSYDSLTKEQKLALVEAFKNHSNNGFETRVSLQQFGDYYKKATKNPFVFSDLVIKELESPIYADVGLIANTDTRFITELLNFLLDDFLFIRLAHEDLFKRESSGDPHVSELEVSLYPGTLGASFDMKGGFYDERAKTWRLNPQELDARLENMVRTIEAFSGYSEKAK